MCTWIDYLFFPAVTQHGFYDGALMDCPEVCSGCVSRQCLGVGDGTVCCCGHGVNFRSSFMGRATVGFWVSDELSGRGTVAIDPLLKELCFDRSVLSRIDIGNGGSDAFITSGVNDVMSAISVKMLLPDEVKNMVFENLSRQNICHDLCACLSRLVNDVIGVTVTDKLLKSPLALQRAYWGCRYQQERFKLLRLLLTPEVLLKPYSCTQLRPAEIISRQLEIFINRFRRKEVEIQFNCSSYRLIAASAEAIAGIIHALIDNAVRYSRPSRKVIITLNDSSRGTELVVRSRGPLIGNDEVGLIATAGYRGETVRHDHSGRLGVGLFAASMIATHHLGSALRIEPTGTPLEGEQEIIASVTLPDRAAVLG